MALLSIATIGVDRFDIPFIRPIKVGSEVLHSREGFIVSLTDDKGHTGFGEVAPLPGLDQTSLKRCRDDLAAFKSMLNKLTLQPDRFDITAPWLGMASLPGSFASHTLFGLESALLGLYLQCKLTESSNNALTWPDPLIIPVNGLFIPNSKDEVTAAQIQALQTSGMTTIKIKIGRLSADYEISQILKLADGIGNHLILRLDGNKALSARTYAAFFSALGHLTVEYVEEPLCYGEHKSHAAVPWPLALDESLPHYLDSENPVSTMLPPEVRTVILKPGLLAGLHAMSRCIADARNHGIKTILSSAFNTGVTLATLGAFSRIADLPTNTAHGFDTLRYLNSDVLSDSPLIGEGVLTIPRRLLSEGMHLNHNVLSKEVL
ncbi:MAG: hypothetical protein CVU52_07100 [Deltaproteobacteria bacterium HGW-Deltaproteobacteria-10]|nr:MAG: hypothetical protein CVU52_07100 [Deltaproteobacteria bacterium HGW-Deltaproteobacteria-10]